MSQKKHKQARRMAKMEQMKQKKTDVFVDKGIRQIIKENWKFLLGLCVGVFLLYFNSLDGDFVSDDYATITQNGQIANFGLAVKTLSSTPIVNSLLAILFGVKSSIPYHLFSVLLYLVVLVMGFVCVMLVFGEKKLAMMIILIFAVMPIHVESVAWISGKPYLFVAFYILLAFSLFVRYVDTGRSKYAWPIPIIFVEAFITDHPRPFSLFFLMGLYWMYRSYKVKVSFKKFLPWIVIAIPVFFVIGWPQIMHRINSVNAGYNGSGSLFYNPFFQYPTGISKYLQLTVFPFDLTLYHTMFVIPAWLNWLILLNFIAILIYGWFRDKRYFFAVSFFLITLAPSIAPVKVSWLVAERYGFLPSLGLAILFGLLLSDWWTRLRLIIPAVFVCLLILYSVRTVSRNDDWQTNHKLWVNTVQVSFNSHNAWNNIGDDYDKLGQLDNAVKGFTQSTVMKPNYADAFHNRANIFFKMGRLDLARDSYNIALSIAPNMYQTMLSLINIDMVEERWDLAIGRGEKLVEMQPNNFQTHYVFGVILAKAGWKDRAIEEMKMALKLNPGMKEASEAIRLMTTNGNGQS